MLILPDMVLHRHTIVLVFTFCSLDIGSQGLISQPSAFRTQAQCRYKNIGFSSCCWNILLNFCFTGFFFGNGWYVGVVKSHILHLMQWWFLRLFKMSPSPLDPSNQGSFLIKGHINHVTFWIALVVKAKVSFWGLGLSLWKPAQSTTICRREECMCKWHLWPCKSEF